MNTTRFRMVLRTLIAGCLALMALSGVVVGALYLDHLDTRNQYAGSLEAGEAQDHATRTMIKRYGANVYGWSPVGEAHKDHLVGIGAWRFDYRNDQNGGKLCVFVWHGESPVKGYNQDLSIVKKGAACGS